MIMETPWYGDSLKLLKINSLIYPTDVLCKPIGTWMYRPLIIDFRSRSGVESLLGKRPHGTHFVNVEPNNGQQFCSLFSTTLKRGFYLRRKFILGCSTTKCSGMHFNRGVFEHTMLLRWAGHATKMKETRHSWLCVIPTRKMPCWKT
jgi:hypothetical protein